MVTMENINKQIIKGNLKEARELLKKLQKEIPVEDLIIGDRTGNENENFNQNKDYIKISNEIVQEITLQDVLSYYDKIMKKNVGDKGNKKEKIEKQFSKLCTKVNESIKKQIIAMATGDEGNPLVASVFTTLCLVKDGGADLFEGLIKYFYPQEMPVGLFAKIISEYTDVKKGKLFVQYYSKQIGNLQAIQIVTSSFSIDGLPVLVSLAFTDIPKKLYGYAKETIKFTKVKQYFLSFLKSYKRGNGGNENTEKQNDDLD